MIMSHCFIAPSGQHQRDADEDAASISVQTLLSSRRQQQRQAKASRFFCTPTLHYSSHFVMAVLLFSSVILAQVAGQNQHAHNVPDAVHVKSSSLYLRGASEAEDWEPKPPDIIKNIGGDGNPAGKLGVCEGDCDNDDDCAQGLYCWQRDDNDPGPPGCKGSMVRSWDYCYSAYNIKNIAEKPTVGTKLRVCEGACDNDDDCAQGLRCWQRKYDDVGPPNCVGSMNRDWSYCYAATFLHHSGKPPRHHSWDYCDAAAASPSVAAPPLAIIKNTGENPVDKLGVCEGDCDNDDDCAQGLRCWQRKGDDTGPPGCTGSMNSNWDYCFAATFLHHSQTPGYKLGVCEGDCDNDNDCARGLRCWQRDGNKAGPPGCTGSMLDYYDYCYLPSTINNISAAPGKTLGLCEGDCDKGECAKGLTCWERDGTNAGPPGCTGSMVNNWDYCYAPTKFVDWKPSQKLGLCEGDCDNNDDCARGLRCWHPEEGNNADPPGCSTPTTRDSDYCYY